MLVLCLTAALVGCSGSSGGSGGGENRKPGGTTDPQDATAATLSFSASAASVEPGDSTTLTWRTSNVRTCDASGAWSGSRATSGSATVGPLNEDATFRLSCSGEGGGVTRQVTVVVDEGTGPRVRLSADPEQVGVNGRSTLRWSSREVENCSASGGWGGTRALDGSFDTGPLAVSTSYTLSCTGPAGNALAAITVEVLDKTLRWQAPTQNVDGSPLNDLAGYVIYWGHESRTYLANHTINDPDVTEWVADIPPGQYFFALTALDADGHESGYSNEVRKTIPQ